MTPDPGTLSEAVGHLRAYVAAIPSLYDDENPMPEGLTIDTATDWTTDPQRPAVRHDLLYHDLCTIARLAAVPARDDLAAKVEALHVPVDEMPFGDAAPVCAACNHLLPCPTLALLADPEPDQEQP